MSLFDRHKIFLLQNYLLYAIAFFIPLIPKLVPVLIIGFGACSIFAIVRGFSRVDMSEISILLLVLFVMHLIGMLYTENQARGWFDIEVKLSLMAFPLAFVGFRFLTKTNYRRILKAFLLGSIASASFCFLQSTYDVLVLGRPYYYFITSRFSVVVHQSYFALYLIFSIIIAIYLYWPIVQKSIWKSVLNLSSLLFLSIAVILTGSKTGFVMWVVIALSLTVVLIKELKYKWVPIVGLTLVMSLIGIIFEKVPVLQSRLVNVLKVAQSDGVNPSSSESTAVRYLVYSSALDVIKSQDWYGHGTGDFQDELDKIYNERDYRSAADKHLNAHNLFLQTWISVGIPGFILVLGVFILMFYQSIRSRDMVMMGFTTIFLIISLTESTFNVQAGVVFFSFFAVLLARRSKVEHKKGLTAS